MHYDEIVHLQTHHSAWNLLRSPHAPLVLSFLGRIFIEPNAGGQPAAALISQLDDELYALNIRLGDDAFPRTAQAYLDEWASPEKGWLRKYYPVGTDEAHYDVTPPVEKAPALDQGSADPGFRRHGVTTEYVVRAAPSDGVRGGHRSRQSARRIASAARRTGCEDRTGRARRGGATGLHKPARPLLPIHAKRPRAASGLSRG
jgi:hypothetical protein